jgi:hypothetical protein
MGEAGCERVRVRLTANLIIGSSPFFTSNWHSRLNAPEPGLAP